MATDELSGWEDIPADPSDPSGTDTPVLEASEWREVHTINEDEREIEAPIRPRKRQNPNGRIIA